MAIAEDLVSSVDKVLGEKEKSKKVARQVMRDFGGSQIYIPLERSAFKEDIENEMYEMYNGANISEIARKYSCSFTTVYDSIKHVRKRRAERKKTSKTFD